MALRREVPRERVDWEGQYSIEGDPERRWRPCRVVDISPAGAGLELLETTSEEMLNRPINVLVPLRGNIRHSGSGDKGSRRVGIEFVDLGRAARVYLRSCLKLPVRW